MNSVCDVNPLEEVSLAIQDALRMRATSFDALKHLLLCRIEQRPPPLDLGNYPHLPLAQVTTTEAATIWRCWVKRSQETADEDPQVLPDHHLKTLRLPTFLREYDKVAQQCAAEGVDYPPYLLRLSEQELLGREGEPRNGASNRRVYVWWRAWTVRYWWAETNDSPDWFTVDRSPWSGYLRWTPEVQQH
jgi:hypothetical protein